MSKDRDVGTIKERLVRIETLLDNHLAHCEIWLKVYLPLLITSGLVILGWFLKK